MSIDHRPEHPQELRRIIDRDGFVTEGWDGSKRFLDMLTLSRSLGHRDLRPFGLTAEPHLDTIQLTDDDSCLILGSDGLFSKVNSQEAVDIVKRHDNPTLAADELTDTAGQYGSEDNTTAMVIRLKGWGKWNDTDYTQLLRQFKLDQVFGRPLEFPPNLLQGLDDGLDRKQILSQLFAWFDRRQTGELTPQDVQQGFSDLGTDLSDNEVDILFSSLDTKGTGIISLEEFFKVM